MTTVRIQETRQHPMKGAPPAGYSSWTEFAKSIPVYERVDLAALTEGDPDPFFLALDVLKLGATSLNGLTYDERLVSAIEKQLAGKGAILGHVPESAVDSAFPIEAMDWVGHVRIGDTTYAKGYMPPGQEREFVKRIMRRGGQLRTSIQGSGVRERINDSAFRLRDFTLDRLDLVPASQAALRQHTSGQPIITSEMAQGDPMPTESNMTLADVPQAVREAILREAQVQADASRVSEMQSLISELSASRDSAQARVSELESALNEGASRIAELETRNSQYQTRIAELERLMFERTTESAISALTAGWQVRSEAGKAKLSAIHKQVRRAVLEALGDKRDETSIRETAQAVWNDEFQGLAEALRAELAGPAGIVPPAPQAGTLVTSLSDADVQRLATRFVK